MNPKISVILPTFNGEDKIEGTINSLIHQTFGFENIELIVLNDCSSDNTRSIVEDFIRKYPNNIKLINWQINNGSPGALRNWGIKIALSDYVMFIDDDDYYCPKMCEKLYNCIVKEKVDFVSANSKKLLNGKIIENDLNLKNMDKNFLKFNSISDFPELLQSIKYPGFWSKIYSKKFLQLNNIEFLDKDFAEDFYFLAQCYLEGNFILLNNFTGHLYRINDNFSLTNNLSKSNFIKHLNGAYFLYYLFEYEEYYESNWFQMVLVNWTRMFLNIPLNINEKKQFFNDSKFLYKKYKLSTRFMDQSLIINIILNIFIKFFSLNFYNMLILMKFYQFFHIDNLFNYY